MPTNQDLQLAAHLRSQVTTLTRRLRREAQADPVQFSQLVVLGAIDRLGGDVTPSSWPPPSGCARRIWPRCCANWNAEG